MTSARRPLPTDIVALVTFDGRVYPNEARPLDRLGVEDRTNPLETALEQWFSFATHKHTWISVRGTDIQGLLSARPRAKRSAWEVEVLINATEDEHVCLSLFSRMTAAIGKLGAERVFLRLEQGSPLLHVARSAGFFAYSQERLYRYQGRRADRPAPDAAMRTRNRNDMLGLYELYRRVAPGNVRAIEGATFREWLAAQQTWSGRPVDLVDEEDGVIRAWLRLSRGRPARLGVLAQEDAELVRRVLNVALARLPHSQVILALAPHYSRHLVSSLAEAGFEPVAEYITLAKRIAKPAEELVQEATGKALPVG